MIAVIILSMVLFLSLPLAVLIAIDTQRMKSEVRAEVRELRRLKREIISQQRSLNERKTDP